MGNALCMQQASWPMGYRKCALSLCIYRYQQSSTSSSPWFGTGLAGSVFGVTLAEVAAPSRVFYLSHPYHSLDISILITGYLLVISKLTLCLSRKYLLNDPSMSIKYLVTLIINYHYLSIIPEGFGLCNFEIMEERPQKTQFHWMKIMSVLIVFLTW